MPGFNCLRRTPSKSALAALLMVLVTLVGCGSKDMGTVAGRVTKNGMPQPKLGIEFAPVAGGRHSTATTDTSGHYELVFTYEKMGALVGTHHVTIKIPEKINPDKMIVLTPAMELISVEREVSPGSNVIDFDLAEGGKSK